MSYIETIRRKATGLARRVVLPESSDPRTIAAAVLLQRLGLPQPVLLGEPDPIRRALDAAGGDGSAITVLQPATDPRAGPTVRMKKAVQNSLPCRCRYGT